jgi:hypothetical protein
MMRRRIPVMVVVGIAVLAGAAVIAQGTTPGAPGSLTFQVSGGSVWLNWISSTGMVDSFNTNTSFYRLEAADRPGGTFFTFDSATLVDPTKMPHLLTSFATGGVGAGNYYVRVRGVTNGVVGPPSNEVLVPVTGGCQAPGAPTDFTAVTRGDTVYLGWNDGNGGRPASYTVHARYGSITTGAGVIATLETGKPPAVGTEPQSGGYYNVGGVPTGVYYVVVYAVNSCGQSAASNEIVVTAPNNGAAVRTPDAPTGRLPWFYVRQLVLQAGAAAGNRINGFTSCPQRPGFPWITTAPANAQEAEIIERQKTQRNPYVDFMVAYLRQFDLRFGYNAKPTRANVNAIVAGDEIAYQWGSDAPEGSPNVYIFDTLGGHCTFGRESVDFRPFFTEYGRWTSAGAF